MIASRPDVLRLPERLASCRSFAGRVRLVSLTSTREPLWFAFRRQSQFAIRTNGRRRAPQRCLASNVTAVWASKESCRRVHMTTEKLGEHEKVVSNKPASNLPVGDRIKVPISILSKHENIYNIPNLLTFSRLLATPALGYFILHDQYTWAVGLLAYASITDLADGWLARRWKMQTVVGSVVDPMADKFLMVTLVACLTIKGTLPLWLATLIFGRDASLAIAAIYYRYASLPKPKTFVRYWDFSLPSAEVHPTNISKYNTFLQLVLLGAVTAMPLAPKTLAGIDVNQSVAALTYLVAFTTIWSGATYTWRKDVVKILGENGDLKKKQGARGRLIIAVTFAVFLTLASQDWLRRERKTVTSGANTELG